MADHVSRRCKRKTVQFRGMFVWIIVFYFYIFLPHVHFIKNGYKRFSKTNLAKPTQRVPLKKHIRNRKQVGKGPRGFSTRVRGLPSSRLGQRQRLYMMKPLQVSLLTFSLLTFSKLFTL